MSNKQSNPYTKSMRKNPENTGSMWCAKNAKDWDKTTHFHYYKDDPQVQLGGKIIILILFICLAVGVILMFDWTKDFWILPVGVLLGICIGRIGGNKKK